MATESDQVNEDPKTNTPIAPDPMAAPVTEASPTKETTPDPTVTAANEAPAPPAPPEAEPKREDLLEEMSEEIERIEHLTEEDVKAAIHWLMGTLPGPLRDAFYTHHPKFRP